MDRRTVLEEKISMARQLQNMALRLGFTDDARYWVQQENAVRRELVALDAAEEVS